LLDLCEAFSARAATRSAYATTNNKKAETAAPERAISAPKSGNLPAGSCRLFIGLWLLVVFLHDAALIGPAV
jgi:hypothetical protein